MTTSKQHQEESAKLAAMIRDVPVATLTTRSGDGRLTTRPMVNVNSNFQGDLWFFTPDDDPKVADIANDPNVNACFAAVDAHRFVSASGRAALTRDRKRIELLWSEACEPWFDQGLDDPKLALIRIDVEQAEYWDVNTSGAAAAKGYFKRLTGGKDELPVEHAAVDWSQSDESAATTASPAAQRSQ